MPMNEFDPETNALINEALSRRGGGQAPTPALSQAQGQPVPVQPSSDVSPMSSMKPQMNPDESTRKMIVGALKGELERLGQKDNAQLQMP